MIRVLISELKEGQVLAEPVEVQGRILLGAGVALTQSHLRIFRTWGVMEAAVEGDVPETESAEISARDSEELRAIRLEIDKRFAKSNCDDEIIIALKKNVLKMAAERRVKPPVPAIPKDVAHGTGPEQKN